MFQTYPAGYPVIPAFGHKTAAQADPIGISPEWSSPDCVQWSDFFGPPIS